MILKETLDEKNSFYYDPNVMIPAIYEDGKLSLVNNGISEIFFGSDFHKSCKYKEGSFQFYALSTGPVERAFFVGDYNEEKGLTSEIRDKDIEEYNGVTFWEMFNVYSKRKVEHGAVKKKELQYTCLRQCRPGTQFCKCDDCGEHFIVTPQMVAFYHDRGLVSPVIRCPKCIQKKKMRFASKNKK